MGSFRPGDMTCRVSGVPKWGHFINYLKWKLTRLVGCERWALVGLMAGRCQSRAQNLVPQAPRVHREERTAQEVKCRSPIFELCLWITEFTSLWPGSEAAAWTSPVLWHSHRFNPVQVELQVLIYKTRRWGRGGTNTASSKEQNIGVSPNLCSVPLGTSPSRRDVLSKGILAAQGEHWSIEIL